MSKVKADILESLNGMTVLQLTELRRRLPTAWATFNSNTAVMEDSFNISTASLEGTAFWQVNFTTPMDNEDYLVLVGGYRGSGTQSLIGFRARKSLTPDSVNSFNVQVKDENDADSAPDHVFVVVYGGKD